MNEFLYLFRGGDARDLDQSPAQREAHMQKWGEWMGKLGQEGTLVAGQPLKTEGKVVAADGLVTDGPFAEGKEIVGGYLIVKAGNLGEAAEISKSCPIFEYQGTVEVREITPLNM